MGAEKGILFRDGAAIQALKDVKMIVFDKTGTLTKGQPTVTDVIPQNGLGKEELLRMTASLEFASEHPLGKAIIHAAAEAKLSLAPVGNFHALPGQGIAGEINGKRILVGTSSLMKDNQVNSNAMASHLSALEAESKTAVLTAIDGKVAGAVALADEIKPEAPAAIEKP